MADPLHFPNQYQLGSTVPPARSAGAPEVVKTALFFESYEVCSPRYSTSDMGIPQTMRRTISAAHSLN